MRNNFIHMRTERNKILKKKFNKSSSYIQRILQNIYETLKMLRTVKSTEKSTVYGYRY